MLTLSYHDWLCSLSLLVWQWNPTPWQIWPIRWQRKWGWSTVCHTSLIARVSLQRWSRYSFTDAAWCWCHFIISVVCLRSFLVSCYPVLTCILRHPWLSSASLLDRDEMFPSILMLLWCFHVVVVWCMLNHANLLPGVLSASPCHGCSIAYVRESFFLASLVPTLASILFLETFHSCLHSFAKVKR